MIKLNDIQSKLNETSVQSVSTPATVEEIRKILKISSAEGIPICPAGALHSMGGQQFAEKSISISSKNLTRIWALDKNSKTVWAEGGVTWTELVEWLKTKQIGSKAPLTIIQKQTGADNLTLGGALSSNIHGRVLNRKPIIEDVVAFNIVTPSGERLKCSREENFDLFSLAIGGYGMLGIIDSVQLKLTERTTLIRHVEETSIHTVIDSLEGHAEHGALYGDFQYMTDETSPNFLSKGILSVYSPSTKANSQNVGLSMDQWKQLYFLAHTDKAVAYKQYASHYKSTHGQTYSSDEHQFSPYLPEAGDLLNKALNLKHYRSLMISELYVPRNNFIEFMEAAGKSLKSTNGNVIYGTVRLIDSEKESFLNWAKKDYACTIFNLLVEHTVNGLTAAQAQFQGLIDAALNEGGSYYLTYHKWARRDQVESAYPQFGDFIKEKESRDKSSIFTSNWYRHHVNLLS